MSFQLWCAVFIGMVLSILLLNVVQWMIYRDRSYGLYTGYMLAWVFYFGLRVYTFRDWFAPELTLFILAVAPLVAYYVYFDFIDAILDLRRRSPAFFQQLKGIQIGLLLYIVTQAVVCSLPSIPMGIYNALYLAIRLIMAIVAVYGIWQMVRLGDRLSRIYALGTTFLLTGALTSLVLSLSRPGEDWNAPFWQVSVTYMQVGIIAELVCFTLGLNYRQRRAAIRSALVEQELLRERERHHRDQLEAELALQRLEQEKVEIQIRGLQAQVNPHFLFNSLNSLSALIEDKNTQQAGRFLDELSTVYRYLLRANEAPLVPLTAELDFLDSYYHLLKTRHGDSLTMVRHVLPSTETRQVPPLTLQLLIENAVKHNVILPDQPLTIQLSTDEANRLVVRNNIQRKPTRALSNGVGLSNILAKYQMLGQPAPTIEDDGREFRVTLPLV